MLSFILLTLMSFLYNLRSSSEHKLSYFWWNPRASWPCLDHNATETLIFCCCCLLIVCNCNECPLKARVVRTQVQFIYKVIQTSKHRQTWLDMNRLDMKQTLHGMNTLDSPTAGDNINTRPGTRQWHGYLSKQSGSHDMNKPMRRWHNEQGNQ